MYFSKFLKLYLQANDFKSLVISSFCAYERHDIEKSILASLWSPPGWNTVKVNEGSLKIAILNGKFFTFEGNGFNSFAIWRFFLISIYNTIIVTFYISLIVSIFWHSTIVIVRRTFCLIFTRWNCYLKGHSLRPSLLFCFFCFTLFCFLAKAMTRK